MTAPQIVPSSGIRATPALSVSTGGPPSPDFASWQYADAAQALALVIAATLGEDAFADNFAFVEEQDHWQKGDTWMGPNGGSDLAVRSRVLEAVERQFTPVDVINEVLDNVANALLKREASVTFTPREPAGAEGQPSDTQIAEAEQMQELIAAWWDRVKLWKHARKAARRARWAMRGALRIWVPQRALVKQDGQPARLKTGLSFADALASVHLTAPAPDDCCVYVDPDTQERAAIFFYMAGEAGDTAAAEVWFVGAGGQATARILVEGEDARDMALPLGGRLPINEMEGELLITEPVRRQQNRLNFFESLIVRVGETAGFPERYTLNAMPQGIWMEQAPTDTPALETQEIGGKTWYLHAAPRTLGASITTDLRGIVTTDKATGAIGIADPDVKFREPTDPAYAVRASEHARNTILTSCKQGHLASEAQAQASGVAYEQGRARFVDDLESGKGAVEGLVRDTIDAVIAMGGLMSTEFQGFLENYRTVVNIHINAGPISTPAMTENREQYNAGLLSGESAMTRNGVEDTTAELALIAADPNAQATVLAKQAAAIKSLTDAGASLEGAAEFIGIDPEQAKKLVGTDLTNQDVVQ